VRERTIRLVLDQEHKHPSRWAEIASIAAKIGSTAQAFNEGVKKAEVNAGRAGVPTEMAERKKTVERENRELWQAKPPASAGADRLHPACRGGSELLRRP
jgi:transposase-like protein